MQAVIPPNKYNAVETKSIFHLQDDLKAKEAPPPPPNLDDERRRLVEVTAILLRNIFLTIRGRLLRRGLSWRRWSASLWKRGSNFQKLRKRSQSPRSTIKSTKVLKSPKSPSLTKILRRCGNRGLGRATGELEMKICITHIISYHITSYHIYENPAWAHFQ